jgi:hypothetical protein
MRYVPITLIGLLMIIGGATVASFAVYGLVATVSCTSSTLPSSACPVDLEKLFYLLFGGLAVGLGGIAVFGGRGEPPRGAGTIHIRAGAALWCALFFGISFAGFWAVWGTEAISGGDKFGGVLIGSLFAVMAVGGLPLLTSGTGSARTGARRGANPLPPLLGAVAFAGGLLGGLEVAHAVGPELPDGEIEAPIAGDHPDSFFHAGPLRAELARHERELGSDQPIARVDIEPERVEVTTSENRARPTLGELPADAPARMIAGINRTREQLRHSTLVGLEDVRSFSWRTVRPPDSEWYVLLDIAAVGPPTRFAASRDGQRVALWGAEPARRGG